MILNKLSIKDGRIFNKYLKLAHHELSAYSFENIYLWKELFDIRWQVIKDSLCVFFRDKMGCFLYLAPLTKKIEPAAIKEIFRILDGFNKNKDISRIENAEEKDLPFYRGLGYACAPKFPEYLCPRLDLARLSGNKFKAKRASFNYFIRHYQYQYLPFLAQDKENCLKLYLLWMKQRKNKSPDALYQGMLKDSLSCLKILLNEYRNLNFLGRVVKVGKKIKAFSFGFKLNQETFCILYEITDLSVKGLAQFIFRQFCAELKEYTYINIMDDSGLENLKKVKLSYHPLRLIPAYIIKRGNG
jgi:hypothetical protein